MFILARLRSIDSHQSSSAAGLLDLATAPTFAVMAWLSADDIGGMPSMSGSDALPIGEMSFMYLLMCVFHLSPWLKLAFARSRPFIQPTTRVQGD